MSTSEERARAGLEVALFRLALGQSGSLPGEHINDPYYRQAIEFVEGRLNPSVELRHRVELRMRLALHLSPAAAVDFDPGGSHSREDLVYEFLREAFKLSATNAKWLAQDVSRALESWDVSRGHGVGKALAGLVEAQD